MTGNGMFVEQDGTILPIQLPNGDKLPSLPNQQVNIIKYKQRTAHQTPSEPAEKVPKRVKELKRLTSVLKEERANFNQWVKQENQRMYKSELKSMRKNFVN